MLYEQCYLSSYVKIVAPKFSCRYFLGFDLFFPYQSNLKIFSRLRTGKNILRKSQLRELSVGSKECEQLRDLGIN